MEEEVSKKTVNLAWQTTKLTAKGFYRFLKSYLDECQKNIREMTKRKDSPIKGQQTVKQLVGQGQGVSSMEIGDSGIRDFKRIANKYGVDFAITKDNTLDPPKYTVFFKAKDADAITSVLKEYAAKQTKRKKSMEKDRPSILQKLKKFKELVANLPHKAKEKIKEPER
ncbi:MAG: PcfB family protein [Lachnospiraceae bacterium]|nr:PcfB family protein [Lachnospiraceae bacterium]